MVIVTDLLIMVGLPIVLFIVHCLWPEAVERRKNLVITILAAWFIYTFFGSRFLHGENYRFIIFSASVVGALATAMFLIIKNFPDHARNYDKCFRIGFAVAAAAAVLAGGRFF